MKKYTHAWIAFKAIERLENAELGSKRDIANSLIKWFKNHRDGVIQGAWYPDSIIKDNSNSHVYKYSPASEGETTFRKLQSTNLLYKNGQDSDLFEKPYRIDVNDNLPNRCEALAHSIIDNLKIQESEEKGSPISLTDNHIALRFFMLSHYIADAHMPFHCDNRPFSASSSYLHSKVEKEWEDEVELVYEIDYDNNRFYYKPDGYPMQKEASGYDNSIIREVDKELSNRKFVYSWGGDNDNVMEFMMAISQYSYLLSYSFIPANIDISSVNSENWSNVAGQNVKFDEMSIISLAEAIESVARIWLRVWARYRKWLG